MDFSFRLLDWFALIRPEGSNEPRVMSPLSAKESVAIPKRLPMMLSRRMSLGSRYAVECALELLERHNVDAIVNASRHAETPRGEKTLIAINKNESPSPTDFTMSVHNAASGILTIHKKLTVPVTSVAAGANTLEAAFLEAMNFLHDGKETVLVLSYENLLPEILGERLPPVKEPFAVALLLQKGNEFKGTSAAIEEFEPETPDMLQWIEGVASGSSLFTVRSGSRLWTWRKA